MSSFFTLLNCLHNDLMDSFGEKLSKYVENLESKLIKFSKVFPGVTRMFCGSSLLHKKLLKCQQNIMKEFKNLNLELSI